MCKFALLYACHELFLNRCFEPRSGQTQNCTIRLVNIAPLQSLKRKNIDLLTRNQDNALEWSDMIIHGVRYHYKGATNGVGLDQGRHHYFLIESNLFLSWYSWICIYLELNNNDSFIIFYMLFFCLTAMIHVSGWSTLYYIYLYNQDLYPSRSEGIPLC
jgi:hypothetical protein